MNTYRKKISFLIIILILCILLSIFLGRFFISPKMFFDVISDSIKGVENNPIESSIIFELRIPRIIMNILVGAGLSISGVAFQGIFQNPLVSPDVISVSSGSAFGAVLGILLFGMNSYVIVLALLFGILSVVITYSLSKVRGESSVLSLILSGMVITALFSSLISLVKYTADPYDKLPAITYWLMGSFSSSSYNNIKIAIFKYLVVFSFSWKNPFIPQLAPVQILTTHTCLLYSLLVLNFLYFLALNLSFLSCHFHQKF